jgi:cytosine/adenosine deaminase-related metal-dependent hydrolase
MISQRSGTLPSGCAPPDCEEAVAVTYDLILRRARVIDPSQKLDAMTDIAFAGGKVARIAPDLPADAGTEVRDLAGAIVTPGLIDLHTHVYWGGTSLGIDAEDRKIAVEAPIIARPTHRMWVSKVADMYCRAIARGSPKFATACSWLSIDRQPSVACHR